MLDSISYWYLYMWMYIFLYICVSWVCLSWFYCSGVNSIIVLMTFIHSFIRYFIYSVMHTHTHRETYILILLWLRCVDEIIIIIIFFILLWFSSICISFILFYRFIYTSSHGVMSVCCSMLFLGNFFILCLLESTCF